MKRNIRLKSAEYKKILDQFRICLPKNLHQEMALVVQHINWLENDRLLLERELSEVRNAKLFDKPLYEAPKKVEAKPIPDMAIEEFYYSLFFNKDLMQNYLSLGKKSRAELLAIANEWATKNNKPLIPE